MGILDLFKRKKKEEDWQDLGTPAFGDYGPASLPGAPALPQARPSDSIAPMPTAMAPITPSRPVPAEADALKREIEALNYKVDALKSTLDLMNQRLASIEEAVKGKQGSVY